jgi:hypothetical protein
MLGEQGYLRERTLAQLRNEKHVFPIANRQKCHWISGRVTQGSAQRRKLLNSPFKLADSSAPLLSLQLSLLLTAFKVAIQREWKEKATVCHFRPRDLAVTLSSLSFKFPISWPRGSGKRIVHHALGSSFVHIKWDLQAER